MAVTTRKCTAVCRCFVSVAPLQCLFPSHSAVAPNSQNRFTAQVASHDGAFDEQCWHCCSVSDAGSEVICGSPVALQFARTVVTIVNCCRALLRPSRLQLEAGQTTATAIMRQDVIWTRPALQPQYTVQKSPVRSLTKSPNQKTLMRHDAIVSAIQ